MKMAGTQVMPVEGREGMKTDSKNKQNTAVEPGDNIRPLNTLSWNFLDKTESIQQYNNDKL